MLIERTKGTAIRSLSVRTDLAAYDAIHDLAKALNSTPSVILRVAILDLLNKAKRVDANSRIAFRS